MRRVAIVGAGLAKFGMRNATFRELVQEASKSTFDSCPALDKKKVDSMFVGAAQPERFAYQSYVAPLAEEMAGIEPWRVIARTELACASGQSAMRYAYACIASGMSDIAFVLGAEKMYTKSMAETQTSMIDVLDREFDGVMGGLAPPYFAMIAQRHMHEYGSTREQMAAVRVKAGKFAATNPFAQFPKPVTKEEVLAAKVVAPPFTLLDCSGITDGAAGLIMCAEEHAKKLSDAPTWIWGTGQCAMGHNLANIPSFTEWVPLKRAAKEAWRTSRLSVKKMDFMEVHDCFTISEMMIHEDLGLCKKGEGGKFAEDGQSALGGKMPTNPRGGLLGTGHPLGATGIAQAVEVHQQFSAAVPKERYIGGEHAMSHNLSGPANTHSIMVYGRKKPKAG